jgi:hypothetical protein
MARNVTLLDLVNAVTEHARSDREVSPTRSKSYATNSRPSEKFGQPRRSKVKVRKGRMLLVFATAIAVGGCAATRRHEARDTGDLLVAAGFKTKLADSPERAQQLRAMLPLKIVSQSKDGHTVYRYADPYSCDCLYVGDQQAYAKYRSLALQKQRADERLEAEEDASMNWDLWGPRW